MRWAVPFFRSSREISGYGHLARRFGPWARNYCTCCFVIYQIGRTGTVLFLVSVAMHTLLGWDVHVIIIGTGVLVTIYTLMGGLEAVIWTDVVQAIVLVAGGLLCLALLLAGMPGGLGQVWEIAQAHGKFGVGSFRPSLSEQTFWLLLVFSLFRDFATGTTDQTRVQRYKSVRSTEEARRSVWLHGFSYCALAL